MDCFHTILLHLKAALEATYVGIEVAAVGAVIAWLQLQYAKKRDRALDDRNDWEKIHKLMLEFVIRREVLNNPNPYGKGVGEAVLDAFEALHNLKGQLDRTPDSPLVNEIVDLLQDNWDAEKWRAPGFIEPFSQLAHKAALRAQGGRKHA
jgi:hypothetical protein